MKGYYFARLNDKPVLSPADERSLRVVQRMEFGEARMFRPVSVRDIRSHRRYWKLVTVCSENCEQIEIAPGRWMEVKTPEDVHVAIKFCTGLYHTILDNEGRPMMRVVKSTSFEEMTREEWDEYWPRVLDVIEEKILPGVALSDVVIEIHKLMGYRNTEDV